MVYTYGMPSRRRKTTTHKMTAQAAPEAVPEEEKPVEEVRPPVTQVVEVVEEDKESPEIATESVSASPVQEEMEEPIEESLSRKEKVEELYHGVNESSVMPEISVHKNKPIVSIFVWAIVTIFVAILTGGILFAIAKKTSPMKLFTKPTPTQTVTPTMTPTPTLAVIDKKSFEIKVLNGGGTPGAAGKMKTFLEDKGYTVSDTGNTDEYTYELTEIHGKTTMKDAILNLKADLAGTYTLSTVAADLSASASSDVEVVVGK